MNSIENLPVKQLVAYANNFFKDSIMFPDEWNLRAVISEHTECPMLSFNRKVISEERVYLRMDGVCPEIKKRIW